MPAITYTIIEIAGPLSIWGVYINGFPWLTNQYRLDRIEAECAAFDCAMRACQILPVR